MKKIEEDTHGGDLLLTYSMSLSWRSSRALRGLGQLVLWILGVRAWTQKDRQMWMVEGEQDGK